MDNNKKLSEGLLKADGIDPAGATESERIAFGTMLEGKALVEVWLTNRQVIEPMIEWQTAQWCAPALRSTVSCESSNRNRREPTDTSAQERA